MGLKETLSKFCIMKSVREKAKDSEKELKKQDQEEMKEEAHQLDLKEGYEQDENMMNQKIRFFCFPKLAEPTLE